MTALRDTDKALAGVQTKLDTLVTDIKALSISSSLSSLIGTDGKLDAATIADFMLSPTVISEQAVYPVASYGSGMAPLFTTLSLWVGAFVLVVIPKLETDDEGIDDLTPTQGYLGRFLLLATLAAVQGWSRPSAILSSAFNARAPQCFCSPASSPHWCICR